MTSPRFGLHADRYRRFRPGYPDAPFDRAAEACGAPQACAVDLGAGSGQATGQVLKRFARVLAVEPDADMAGLIPPDPRLSVQVATAEPRTWAKTSTRCSAPPPFTGWTRPWSAGAWRRR